jgi:hypothetical protein
MGMKIHQDVTTSPIQPTIAGSLEPTVSVTAAARLLRMSRAAAYRAVKARLEGDEAQWPTTVIKVGRSVRIPTTALLEALGISVEDALRALHSAAPGRTTDQAPAA